MRLPHPVGTAQSRPQRTQATRVTVLTGISSRPIFSPHLHADSRAVQRFLYYARRVLAEEKGSSVVMRVANPGKIDSVALSETHSTPVFVDPTGRRQRLVRWLAVGVAGGCLAYAALLGVSLTGGPVTPPARLSLPELKAHPQPPSPAPGPSQHPQMVAVAGAPDPVVPPPLPPTATASATPPSAAPSTAASPTAPSPKPPAAVPPSTTRPPQESTPTPSPTGTSNPGPSPQPTQPAPPNQPQPTAAPAPPADGSSGTPVA